MRVAIVRTMPDFSMEVYANGVISGLKTVRPNWEIIDLKPQPVDRKSQSPILRIQKFYERFWRFPQLVKHQVADVYHILDHSEAHITYGLKKLGKPVAVTCHDLINFYYKDNLQGSVTLPFLSHGMWLHSVKGMKQADAVVTVSSMTAKDATKILDIESARISIAPNAVEAIYKPLPEEEIDKLRQESRISRKTLCLLNVGSNHPRKNIDTVLKAIDTLKQQGVSVIFWKAGADFNEEQKIFIRDRNLENNITYLGQPDKSNLVQIYNAADILIAPSFHEGFGITLLEAMACGTPVITSNVSAMPEVVGDAGILVEPNDYQSMANAVIHLQKDSTFRQILIEKALTRVKQFTWESTSEKIAQIYEELMERSNTKKSI
ncbi:group 1 glycosyl transferase [Calothrix parasitica NIES-267]|uniref:Group 1 glycosyl transferase n=1 Tax=Calothrix parasitica NIES-267 TaxID=1973488 RepID=A0A1Z4M1M8_9CYAN|nr:group 1 glycosyl transferase [Calothrix parasitica NIES-267]